MALTLSMSFGLHGPLQAKVAGWHQIWSDEFDGPANTGVDTSKWLYDTGASYPGGAANWGTGEVETTSNSTSNVRSEEHTSELQSPVHLVCRLLLEKKKK